jgi:hypothetical protein
MKKEINESPGPNENHEPNKILQCDECIYKEDCSWIINIWLFPCVRKILKGE